MLKGKGTGIHSVVTGRVKVIRTEQDLLTDFADGDIIVTESTNDLMNSFIERAGAVITENGNLSGHAAMMGLNLSKPTIVGAKEATSILNNGDIITLNGKTGVVVKGTAIIY